MGIEMYSFTENNHLLGVTELSVNLVNSLTVSLKKILRHSACRYQAQFLF
jgi:hypothetical protein